MIENDTLIKAAAEAMQFAYAPYSNFKVGAALITKEGKVYTGCNIENASYGATICAERTAIAKAVSEGIYDFDKIAIVCSSDEPALPCGICLQVLNEFMPEAEVIVSNHGEVMVYKVSELLPYAFRLDL